MMELVHDRLLSAIVCCDIDPASEGAFDQVDLEASQIDNGTKMCPWKCVREDSLLWETPWDDIKPVPCREKPGFWHYVVVC